MNIKIPDKIDISTVVLVALHPTSFPFIGESQGIIAISGYLKSNFNNINVYLFDQQLDSLKEILNGIKQYRPVILGVSVKMKTFDQFQLLYDMIKKEIPVKQRPLIVLGNSTAHFNGETILAKYYDDVLIGLGEGEIVMGDLYNYIHDKQPFDSIRNLMYIQNGLISVTKKEYLNGNLIPLPDRTRTLEFYTKGAEIYIEASRGCAYCGCRICECKDFLGSNIFIQKWRARNLDLIISDLKELEKLGITDVTFADEDFFGNDSFGIDRVMKLSEMILSQDIHIHFRINARVKSIANHKDTEQMTQKRELTIQSLKKAGLVKIFLGLESGTETQLKRYGKDFNLSEFKNAYLLLDKYCIDYELGFILVDPLMSFNELKENLKFIENHNCISKISSIYKELRIQSGNKLYLNQVINIEKQKHIKIIDSFDFNSQEYNIISYIDDKVSFISNLMKRYLDMDYKLYYLFRIYTQYSAENVKENVLQGAFFKIMDFLKKNEFTFLSDLVNLIESKGIDQIEGWKILSVYEDKRRKIIKNLLNRDWFTYTLISLKHISLKEEIIEYLNKSEKLLSLS